MVLASTVLGFVPTQNACAATYQAVVKDVVDGDTIHTTQNVRGTNKIRFLSIDAPESYFQGKNQNPWGENAKKRLKELLPPGTPITIETDREEKDGYGRLLAHVKKGNEDINLRMVREGYAVTYFIWPNMGDFTAYQSALTEARNAHRQIWDEKNGLPELPFEFRLRNDSRRAGEPDKFVGDFQTKKYVAPADYASVDVSRRVFFFKEKEAIAAGYTKKGRSACSVVINELLPAPKDKWKYEFVELYNPTDQPIDLGGYILDDANTSGRNPYVIPPATVIPSKGYFVWRTKNHLGNKGDTVFLKDPEEKIVDKFTYTYTQYDSSWYRNADDSNEWAAYQSHTPTEGTVN